MSRRSLTTNTRFAAKLLFQYRVGEAKDSKFRICEERVVVIHKKTADDAYLKAKEVGKSAQISYLNDEGVTVTIEFVGIIDLMNLGLESEANEVWYEIKTMLLPMERRKTIVPVKRELSAFKLK